MDTTFSNTDAAICGGLAIAELVFFVIYMSVSGIRLRKKIISMGRLIPTIPVVIIGGGMPSHIQIGATNSYNNNYPNNYNNYPPISHIGIQPSPPPPGFVQGCDNPPPYSAVSSQSHPTVQK